MVAFLHIPVSFAQIVHRKCFPMAGLKSPAACRVYPATKQPPPAPAAPALAAARFKLLHPNDFGDIAIWGALFYLRRSLVLCNF